MKLVAYDNIGCNKYNLCKTCKHRAIYVEPARDHMYDHDSHPDGYLGFVARSGFKCNEGHKPRDDCGYYEDGVVDDRKEIEKSNLWLSYDEIIQILENDKSIFKY